MANVKVDFSGLRDFAKQLNTISTDSMCKEAVTQLGAVYIASAKRNTPVGTAKAFDSEAVDKETGKKGQWVKARADLVGGKKNLRKINKNYKLLSSEHMRRSWQMGTVEKHGNEYRIKVSNSASYATFVDKGHRQTPGRFVPILGKKLVGNYVKGLKITDKAEKAVKRAQGGVFRNVISKHTKGV